MDRQSRCFNPWVKNFSVWSVLGLAILAWSDRAWAEVAPGLATLTAEVESRSARDLLPQLAQNPAPNLPEDFPSDSDVQPLDPQDVESELGEIEILPPPVGLAPSTAPVLELLIRSSAFYSSNVFAEEDKNSDFVFINSALLLATPKLGPTTRLIAGVEGGLIRFASEGDANYNLVRLSAGVQQRLAPGTFAQLGWVQDRLYEADDGERLFLNDTARLIVGRQDQIGERLRLDSFYELRVGFAVPKDESRIANSLGVRLRRDLTPELQGTLDYRLTFDDYTQRDRFDTQHQVGAALFYSINPNLLVSGTVSYLFGRSSEASVDLNNLSVGVNIGLNLPLF